MIRADAWAAAAVAIGLSGTALAADLPVKAPVAPAAAAYNWTGFYVGGHVGYGWTHTDWHDPVVATGSVSLETDAAVGGGQIGFNWQTGRLVLGIEADASWTHQRQGIIAILIGWSERRGTTLEEFGTVAGRLGYAEGRWLAYAKGGAAWAHSVDRLFNVGAGGVETQIAGESHTRTGWMAGAGFEYGLASGWSAKVEYNYLGFGRDRVTFTTIGLPGGPTAVPLDIRQTIPVVKLGVNYRFGPR